MTPRCLRVGLDRLRLVELVVLDQRLADRHAARLEEGVGHRAADDQAIDLAEHVLDDVDLVGDLRAADDRDERPLRLLERVPEVLELLLHQQPGRRLLEQCVIASTDACARCAAPNASLT